MKYIQLYCKAFLILLFTGAIAACNKKIDKEFNPERAFAPGRISASSGELTATITWDASLYSVGTLTYEIELSTNETFENIYKTFETTETEYVFTPADIQLKTNYYARVRAKATGSRGASNWEISSSFRIAGEQLFGTLLDTDVRDKQVTLRFRPDEEVTHITILDVVNATSIEVPLEESDIESGIKVITGLNPVTAYIATIYNGSLDRGAIEFTTKEPSEFTFEVESAEELLSVLAIAENGDVIGIKPGEYVFTEKIELLKKHIVFASTSGDPSDTKLIVPEFTVKGDGAGIGLNGLTLDQTGTSQSYLITLVGEGSNADATTFTSVTVENCIIHNISRAIIRGSYGSGASDHKIDFIRIENVLAEELSNDYALFEIQRLAVNNFIITKSTFNGFNQNLIRYDVAMGGFTPTFNFSFITLNGFGNGNRRVLFDLNTAVNLTVTDAIFANAPRPLNGAEPTLNNDLYRVNGGSQTFTNIYTYNLTRADGTTPLNTPGQTFNSVTLPWTLTSLDLTLPADSPLRTAASNGGAVGDPRWAL